MKETIALYDENDKFVLVDSMTKAVEYFDNVLQIGTMLWANGFTEHELKTIPLDQLAIIAQKKRNK